METEDNRSENSLPSEVDGKTDEKLLRELIKSCEEFVVKKEIRSLTQSVIRIFFHGLSLDNHVSDHPRLEKTQFDESQIQRSKFLIIGICCPSVENSLF